MLVVDGSEPQHVYAAHMLRQPDKIQLTGITRPIRLLTAGAEYLLLRCTKQGLIVVSPEPPAQQEEQEEQGGEPQQPQPQLDDAVAGYLQRADAALQRAHGDAAPGARSADVAVQSLLQQVPKAAAAARASPPGQQQRQRQQQPEFGLPPPEDGTPVSRLSTPECLHRGAEVVQDAVASASLLHDRVVGRGAAGGDTLWAGAEVTAGVDLRGDYAALLAAALAGGCHALQSVSLAAKREWRSLSAGRGGWQGCAHACMRASAAPPASHSCLSPLLPPPAETSRPRPSCLLLPLQS